MKPVLMIPYEQLAPDSSFARHSALAFRRWTHRRSGSNGGHRAARSLSLVFCALLVVLPWLTLGWTWWRDHHANQVHLTPDVPGGKQCIGWKETLFCHPFAERHSPGDKGCDEVISSMVAGYCLCEGNITTARVTCGPKRFNCRQRCMQLGINPTDALELPTAISCPYELPYHPANFLAGMAAPPVSWSVDIGAERAKVQQPWRLVEEAIHKHSLSGVRAPGIRNETHDFVREGRLLSKDDVAYISERVEAFKAAIPDYPAAAYQGRGVVMIGGGLRYIMSAWAAVHLLRNTGCRLPIEMWYPLAEAPSEGAKQAFAELGVVTRLLDLPGLNISRPFSKEAESSGNMGRFTIKVAALILSRFQEVIYLDADNFALRDPTLLFDSQQYNDTAAIMWPDFWENTVAPQVSSLLGVPRSQWPSGSFESGQMVVDKARHWRGLVMAMYLNSGANFWYEMLTCYLGKGDKETFAYGMLAVGEPFTLVHTPPRAVGTTGTSEHCDRRSHLCVDEFTGTTMGQAALDGSLLFLHSNMHKWDMRQPEKFSLHYQRRWMKMLPENVNFQQWQISQLGFDLERKVYDLMRMLKCQPWWESYYLDRVDRGDRKTPDLDGFHFLLRGLDMQRMYKLGWDGAYLQYIEQLYQPGVLQRWKHWYQGHLRPQMVGWSLLRHAAPL